MRGATTGKFWRSKSVLAKVIPPSSEEKTETMFDSERTLTQIFPLSFIAAEYKSGTSPEYKKGPAKCLFIISLPEFDFFTAAER